MNSISMICGFSMRFEHPLLLLLLIPAVGLMLWPFFRISRQHRKTRNRIVSLAIHSLVLVLCVSVIAGLSFHTTRVSIKSDVILLVDASDSNGRSEDDMNEFIHALVKESDSGYSIGIVTFANGCVYTSKLGKDPEKAYQDYINASKRPEGNATDIASALLFAREQLSKPSEGRIILLSDGVETDNHALSVVKMIADEGTRIDTVYFAPQPYEEEIMIEGVEVPDRAAVGETIQISVAMRSAKPCSAVLKLYDNKTLHSEQSVELGGGADIFTFDYTLLTPKLHEFYVTLEGESDTLLQNNEYYAFINIEVLTRVLLVDGTGAESEPLQGLLSENYEVTKTDVSKIPRTLEGLSKYDEIVFMNVANADLPAGFGAVLTEYVETNGGGLFTVGGDKAYMQSDMSGSAFQELLPVEANTDAKSLGLLLVIDCSGSMDQIASGSNKTRIELAKEAAIASIETMKPSDYVGVIAFNSSASTLVEMTPVTRKESIIRKIKELKSNTGTYYYNAINSARNMMLSFDKTELKHIIFLTDGEPVDADSSSFMNLIDRLGEVTLSTIALGPTVDIDLAEEMAERGGGRFYEVADESELVEIMVEETVTAAGQYFNEGTFTPVIVNHTGAVAGISELPSLGGYYGTRLKDGATMVLGYNGSPIYAEWSRGKGRVGSFMSDLNGHWSANYFTDANGKQFINNAVNSLFPDIPVQSNEIAAEFAHDNFIAELKVFAALSGGEKLSAEVVSPSGRTTSVVFTKLSGNAYYAKFETKEAGVYAVHIVKKTGGSVVTELNAYTCFSYSSEYAAFWDDTECFNFISSISEQGNGKVLLSADNVFGRNNEITERDYDPQTALLIAIVALFLLDIVVRKFKFKWLHEIVRERRQKKNV